MSYCVHSWDRGECRTCNKFAENLVHDYELELQKTKAQLVDANTLINFEGGLNDWCTLRKEYRMKHPKEYHPTDKDIGL